MPTYNSDYVNLALWMSIQNAAITAVDNDMRTYTSGATGSEPTTSRLEICFMIPLYRSLRYLQAVSGCNLMVVLLLVQLLSIR